MDKQLLMRRVPGLFLGLIGAFFLLKFLNTEQILVKSPAIKDLSWGELNFLHTTDTHGWYSGHLNQPQYHANWGDFVSFAAHMREIADANSQDLILVDTGDRHDGNGLSDVTSPNGAKSLPVFIQQDYDLVTIGNHELYEFQNSKQEYELVAAHYGEKYVCSNVEYVLPNGTEVPFGSKYRYFETKNQKKKVLALSFLFDFNRNNYATRVTPIKDAVEEDWFKDVLRDFPENEVDILVVFGHIPVTHQWKELGVLHNVLRKNYPSIKIQYFGGHSHIRDFAVYDENLTGMQSGRFCETVGWVSVNTTTPNSKSLPGAEEVDNLSKENYQSVIGLSPDRSAAKQSFSRSYIDFNLASFYHHSRTGPSTFSTEKGLSISSEIKKIRKQLNLHKVIGYVTESNYYLDYVPLDNKKNIFKLLTDKVLPTLNSTNPNITTTDNDNRIIIINTGSVRYDLYKGKYTLDSQYIVSPFKNDWVKLTIPKQYAVKIADKLNEWSYIIALERDLNPYIRHKQPENEYEYSIQGSKQPHQLKSKFTKGYLTHDDFGSDGDDTPHKPVVNFPIPNVVQSVQLNDEDSDYVEVVFYEFIFSNIIWALKELQFTKNVEAEFYSDIYMGELLNNYIQEFGA